MKDGDTALTLMPKGASSIAEACVSISRPALLMEYPIKPASGLEPLSQLTLMIQPLDCFKKSRKN